MSDLGEAPDAWLGRDGALPQPEVGLITTLEARVVALVERHREARKTIDELQLAPDERDARLADLARRVEDHEQLRGQVRERVAGLIEHVKQLEHQQPGSSE